MAKRYEVYKCEVCGNIVEVLTGGTGQLVCCGKPMKLMVENTTDAAKEKHVPVAGTAAPVEVPYWKCSNCRYVLQAPAPPVVCPSCQQNCQFTDVTCYIPECGFSGTDNRLIAG